MRSNPELRRSFDDELEFGESIDDEDRTAAESLGEERDFDVGAILVPVTDQQSVRRIQERQGDQ